MVGNDKLGNNWKNKVVMSYNYNIPLTRMGKQLVDSKYEQMLTACL
jgi:hypothetical protein